MPKGKYQVQPPTAATPGKRPKLKGQPEDDETVAGSEPDLAMELDLESEPALTEDVTQACPDPPGPPSCPGPGLSRPWCSKTNRDLIIIWDGHSVCAHVHGFHPYFFVLAPPGFTKEQLGRLPAFFERAVQEDSKSKDTPKDCVLNVELMMKSTIYGFQVSSDA
ncbi:hypothetical protein TCAL_14223 [Tigriopus californicus]|uniref:Uncharacterized protein n=1 Tax=Tigriopus californicus TaxID=6832 RepID=A0A553NSW5_TIGCA|nr:hypothetical protein TCAL_14223 [Tigriopus californicus]